MPAAVRKVEHAVVAQHLAVAPALAACVALADAVVTAFGLGDAFALPLICLPAAAVLGAMSLFAIDGGGSIRGLAAMIATVGMAVQLVLFPGVLSSVACLSRRSSRRHTASRPVVGLPALDPAWTGQNATDRSQAEPRFSFLRADGRSPSASEMSHRRI